MSKIERQIKVNYRHQIHFTEDVFSQTNPLLKDLMIDDLFPAGARKALVLIDGGVQSVKCDLDKKITGYFHHYSESLKLVCAPIRVDGGEFCKNDWGLIENILESINTHHIDRHSYIIAVGGGAILDMVGLAAAVAHRGVRHIRIPTTTLSQDDSGVGVKNGINFFGKKNFLGTFAPPFAVVNDFEFIECQPEREKKNGFIEAVKVALIRDGKFFEEIEKSASKLASFDPESMKHLIYRCAELHVNHIASSGDPFEFGSARPLDFGHWAAHKLEQLSNYKIRHGEAVAVGIAIDTLYSKNIGLISTQACHRILNLIHALGFDLYSEYLMERSENGNGEFEVIRGLEEFREHLGGRLTITLLKDIGTGFETNEMDVAVIKEVLSELRSHSESLMISKV